MRNKNSILNFIKIPDILSLANGVCGLLSIICSITLELEWAAIFIALAGIFDFFDGRVARHLKQASEFGKQLDSLCDLCSFIIAPIVFVYAIESINIYIRTAIGVMYIIAGILRLARFNITGTINNGKYFEGMPVPFSIAIICSYFICQSLGIPFMIWISLFFIHSVLMVSTFKIRKV